MKQKHTLEILLRPKVEIWSATISATGAAMAFIAPWSLMMTPSVAYGVGGILTYNAYRNFRDFVLLSRYQKGLRRQVLFKMAPSDIPVSRKYLFYGLGFRWGQRHAQRLKDTRDPAASKYINPGYLYRLARRKELEWESSRHLSKLAELMNRDSKYNPVRPLPSIGGEPQIHGVGGNEEPVVSLLSERNAHTLVLGTTRVGKTRLAEILITQDIRRGDITVVFDPKGDAELMRRVIAECKAAGREDDLVVFHLGFPDISARYNGIGHFSRVTEVATRTANQLDSGGSSNVFREFFWRFTNIIAQALVALGRRPDYAQLAQHIQSIDDLLIDYYEVWLSGVADPDWQKHVKEIAENLNDKMLPMSLRGKNKRANAMIKYAQDRKLFDAVAMGLRSTFEYDKTYFDKIVASGLPLLEKLISGRIAELISPAYNDTEDNRPVFSWGQVIRQKKVVYIGLDALQDMAIAGTVGNTMFADLVSTAGEIYKHGTELGFHNQDTSSGSKTPINIHADEVNELMGDEFLPMLNKGGGAGLQITAYTQTMSDVIVKLGDQAKAGQALGNFGTIITFRVKELATAELFTEQLPMVEVAAATEVTGSTDSVDLDSEVDFTSSAQDRITFTEAPLLSPATIMALPKGQAFILTGGGQLWKIRVPLADSKNDMYMRSNFDEMAEDMSASYRTSESWWIE